MHNRSSKSCYLHLRDKNCGDVTHLKKLKRIANLHNDISCGRIFHVQQLSRAGLVSASRSRLPSFHRTELRHNIASVSDDDSSQLVASHTNQTFVWGRSFPGRLLHVTAGIGHLPLCERIRTYLLWLRRPWPWIPGRRSNSPRRCIAFPKDT